MVSHRQFREEDLSPAPRPEVTLCKGIHGATNGIVFCDQLEYGILGEHDDQEGFYVISGHGYFRMDNEDIKVGPGMAILIQAHVQHAWKKDPDSEDIKIFWYHAAN